VTSHLETGRVSCDPRLRANQRNKESPTKTIASSHGLHDTRTAITHALAAAHVADDQNLLLLVEPRSGGRSCLTHPSTPGANPESLFYISTSGSVQKPSVSSSFSSSTCCLVVMVVSLVFGSRKSHWQIGELPRRVKVSQLIRSRRATLFNFPSFPAYLHRKESARNKRRPINENASTWYLGRNKRINRFDQGRAIIRRVR